MNNEAQNRYFDLCKKAYAEYCEISRKGGYEFCTLLPFGEEPMKPLRLVYDQMEPEFRRELINSINAFAEHISSVSIWDMVISQYDEDERFELTYEFLKLPMYFCLNQPGAIKARIIYCATHLCHQVNLASDRSYKDDLPKDFNIGERTLKQRLSSGKAGSDLLHALSNMNTCDFKELTGNYRNMAHHRIPPRIEYGLTNFVTRKGYQEDTVEYITMEDGKPVKKQLVSKGVVYAFGSTDPIKAGDILPALKAECENSKKAFYAYQKLINEHMMMQPKSSHRLAPQGF